MTKDYESQGQGRKVKDDRDHYLTKQKWIKELAKVESSIRDFQINFIHRQSHLTMFGAIGSNLKIDFLIAENQKFVSGSLHNLDVFELSGYPQKVYDANITYSPYKILSKKPEADNNSKEMITFKWANYEPMSLPN